MIQEMYSEIQKQTDKHSVSELCGIYGVSRSGYYKWVKRAGRRNRYEKTHEILDNYVMDIHSHHPMMGYRQIRDKLCLEFGWVVSDPTVWKSMKRLGIRGYTRRRHQFGTYPVFQCTEQKIQSSETYAEDCHRCYLYQTQQ